jgi:hypothetical protein
MQHLLMIVLVLLRSQYGLILATGVTVHLHHHLQLPPPKTVAGTVTEAGLQLVKTLLQTNGAVTVALKVTLSRIAGSLVTYVAPRIITSPDALATSPP